MYLFARGWHAQAAGGHGGTYARMRQTETPVGARLPVSGATSVLSMLASLSMLAMEAARAVSSASSSSASSRCVSPDAAAAHVGGVVSWW